jgi:hypothetical protein
MDCTIAPIAGKPATFLSLVTVPTELKSICLQIDADARLAAAVGGAARCFADAGGLETAAVSQLQAVAIAACQEAFEHLSANNPHLEVTLTRFADRIEVALSHHGDAAPAVGLDAIAGFAAQVGGSGAGQGALSGVDRVQYETHGTAVVTRLTKYLSQESSSY